MSKIGILGAGGMAREAAQYSHETVAFFAVNAEFLNSADPNLIDIDNPTNLQRSLKVIAALGAPAVRKQMIETWPGNDYANITAQSADIFSEITGKGIIIAPKAVITTGVEIGDHSIINISSTVSHDSKLGQYVTISPGAHIAGNVQLGDGVFVGIGASISNGLQIAEGTVIGAGAVVTHNIDTPNSVVVGNPARLLRIQEGWMNHV